MAVCLHGKKISNKEHKHQYLKHLKNVVVAFLLVFCTLNCAPTTQQTEIVTESKVVLHPQYRLADSLLNIIKTEAAFYDCPGFAIAIVADTSILKLEGYGIANKKLNTRVNEHTLFRIASLSKSFAALTAKILVKEGKLSFDDKVIQYIPNLKFKDPILTENLTIGHLLSMSTGLATHSYTNLVESNLSLDEIIPSFTSVKPIYPLGQYSTYQNAAFGLIEKVIYNSTGIRYEEHLYHKVFKPLKLKATYTCDDFMEYKNIAWPHNFREVDSTYTLDGFNQKYYNLVSAGGINASANDLAKYVKFLINGDESILPDEYLQELFIGKVAVLPERRSYEKWQYVDTVNYAYGWRTVKLTNGSQWVFHGGYVNRYQSLIVFNPKSKVGMAILFNNDCPIGGEIMKWFVQIFEGLPDEIPSEAIADTSAVIVVKER